MKKVLYFLLFVFLQPCVVGAAEPLWIGGMQSDGIIFPFAKYHGKTWTSPWAPKDNMGNLVGKHAQALPMEWRERGSSDVVRLPLDRVPSAWLGGDTVPRIWYSPKKELNYQIESLSPHYSYTTSIWGLLPEKFNGTSDETSSDHDIEFVFSKKIKAYVMYSVQKSDKNVQKALESAIKLVSDFENKEILKSNKARQGDTWCQNVQNKGYSCIGLPQSEEMRNKLREMYRPTFKVIKLPNQQTITFIHLNIYYPPKVAIDFCPSITEFTGWFKGTDNSFDPMYFEISTSDCDGKEVYANTVYPPTFIALETESSFDGFFPELFFTLDKELYVVGKDYGWESVYYDVRKVTVNALEEVVTRFIEG